MDDLDSIRKEAENVFGSNEKSEKWLNAYNISLGGKPIDMIKTPHGLISVRQLLSAIAYGGTV